MTHSLLTKEQGRDWRAEVQIGECLGDRRKGDGGVGGGVVGGLLCSFNVMYCISSISLRLVTFTYIQNPLSSVNCYCTLLLLGQCSFVTQLFAISREVA